MVDSMFLISGTHVSDPQRAPPRRVHDKLLVPAPDPPRPILLRRLPLLALLRLVSMASSSWVASSGLSSLNQTSCSDKDVVLQALLDQRKRKRMISNRESARQSRMRKQKQLDNLIARSAQLRGKNQQIESGIAATARQYLSIKTENSVLRAQVSKLRNRLESMNGIIRFLGPMGGGSHGVSAIGQLGFNATMVNLQQPVTLH